MTWHRKKFWARTAIDDWCVVDADFDDLSGGTWAALQEIRTKGAISLHPDGNSRCDSPVPLHSHQPDSAEENSEFFSARLFVKARCQEIREHHARTAEEKARIEREMQEYYEKENAKTYYERYSRPPPPKPPAKPSNPLAQWMPPKDEPVLSSLTLKSLRINDPPPRGIGRVWRQYLLLNEEDISQNPALFNRPWVEIWRGEGVIVLERSEPENWYRSDVTWRHL